jgi:predicted signal transduction protein with EAL and GGDEF domain
MSGSFIVFRWWFFQHPWPALVAAFLLPYRYIAFQQFRHRRQNELFRLVSENAADTRMDGYQFTVLLGRIKEPSEPMRVALRIPESLGAPFLANGVEVFTFASIGIALSSPSFQTPTELRDADIAMCRAKASGGSSCEVFDSNMHALVTRRLKLESDLRKSIERDELRVLYQPIVHLPTGRVDGVEALMRWWRNDSELVTPADFIEVAEETGLIVPLGRWILNETCRQAHQWHMQFSSDPLLAATVNVSPRQFAQSNIVADVKSALEESGLNPGACNWKLLNPSL